MDQPLELRFRPTGWGRWLEAVFLSVWLLAWAAGEAFALVMVGGLGWALLSGRAIPNQPDAPLLAVLTAWGAGWRSDSGPGLRNPIRREARIGLSRTDRVERT